MRGIFFCLVLSACLFHFRIPCCGQTDTDSLRGQVSYTPPASARTDSLNDTLNRKPVRFQPNPKKAALYSCLFPGLGQVYNRQYWKLPIVYAGAGIAGYMIVSNMSKHRTYRKAYIARLSREPDEYPFLSDNDLKVLQDGYKQNLDMTVLFSAIGYTIQALDALAAAHLKNFDISDDITMRMQPIAAPNGGIGFGMAVNFK